MKNIVHVLIAFFLTATCLWGQTKPIDSLLGKCPEGQFYFDIHNECVPFATSPPQIDGMDQEEVSAILDEHRQELEQVKGYAGSGLDLHGIFIEVMPDHGPIPTHVGGLPLHTHPYEEAVGMD